MEPHASHFQASYGVSYVSFDIVNHDNYHIFIQQQTTDASEIIYFFSYRAF